MNLEEFFNIRTNCIICNTILDRLAIIYIGHRPYIYTIQNKELYRLDLSQSHFFPLFPPEHMSIKSGYLTLREDCKKRIFIDNEPGRIQLKAICKNYKCGVYDYKSYSENARKTKLKFGLHEETIVVKECAVMKFHKNENNIIIYLGGTYTSVVKTKYKPITEWLKGGDISSLKEKINGFKLLL